MKVYVKTQFVYDKRQSVIISGIAILMMLMHHFWGFPQVLVDDNTFIPLFSIFNISVEQNLGSIGKLCVAIFAFNTGYVIWKNKGYYTFQKNLKRIMKFLVSYWIIYIIYLLYGFIFGENQPSIPVFLYNLIGLNTGYYVDSINVTFAWYVCFYVTFIFFSPILIAVLQQTSFRSDFVLSIVWLWLGVFLKSLDIESICLHIVTLYFTIGFLAWGALLICKYNTFTFLKNILGVGTVRNFILLLTVILVRQIALFSLSYIATNSWIVTLILSMDVVYAPLFVYSMTNIISSINCIYIDKFFSILGKYSMNMWFIHGIFFTASMKIQWILYFPKISIFILVWGLFLVLGMSSIVSAVQLYVQKKLRLI